MNQRELSFVRAAFFLLLMFDVTSQQETHEGEGGNNPDANGPPQAVGIYPWRTRLTPKSAIPIQDEANGDYSQSGKQEHRYLTQDKGNMHNQQSTDKRQITSVASDDPYQSAGNYPWSAEDTDSARGISDTLTKRNKIRKATRRYRRK